MTVIFVGFAIVAASGVIALFIPRPRMGQVFALLVAAGALLIIPGTIRLMLAGTTGIVTFALSGPIGAVSLRLDPLASFFVIIIAGGGALAAVYSMPYLRLNAAPDAPLHAYYLFLGLLIASMLAVTVIWNSILFLVAWEIMSLSSFFLVTFEHDREETRRAGIYYLAAMQVGVIFLICGFSWAASLTGSLDLAGFSALVAHHRLEASIIFLLFFLGFGTKAGLVPLHTWLPQAHPAAPTPVSALMSGVMIKTGIYGILRMLLTLGVSDRALAYAVFFVSLATGIFGVMNAIGQHDMKRLLAYHSVENIGIIGMGIGLGMIGISTQNPFLAVAGFVGAILHVFNHFTFKSLLFYGAGVAYTSTGTRDIDSLGGLVRVLPVTSAFFLLGSAAISGLPLFSGFVSELAIYLGLARGIAGGSSGVAVASLLGIAGLAFIGAMAALCFTKVFGICFLGNPRRAIDTRNVDLRPAFVLPMAVMGILIVVIGLAAPVVLSFTAPVIDQLLPSLIPGPGEHAAAFLEIGGIFKYLARAAAVLVALILLFGGIRRLLLGRKRISRFKTWDCGFGDEQPAAGSLEAPGDGRSERGTGEVRSLPVLPAGRLQYTGSSFASMFLGLVSAIVPQKIEIEHARGPFPEQVRYSSHAIDLGERLIVGPVTRAVAWLLSLARWVQSGRTQQYILYGLIFLVVLVIVVLGIHA